MEENEEPRKSSKVGKPALLISRDIIRREDLCNKTGYVPRDKSLKFALKNFCTRFSCLNFILDLFPVINCLRYYKIKRDLGGDIIGGITVAILQIPQGLAYGLLAGLSARTGLFMAVFPVLVFAFFGTSRHISIGTFAVISMMVFTIVQSHSTIDTDMDDGITNGDTEDDTEKYTPIQVATAAAFLTGLIHLAMFVLRLGMLASLLSECLVQGFTTGAAFHVIFAQLKEAFGVQIRRYRGPFKLIYTLIDLVPKIVHTNIITFAFFAAVFTFLTLSQEVIKPFWNKKIVVPFPAELIAVVGGTLISKYTEISVTHNVTIVGEIPTGLPFPEMPPISLFSKIYLDCIAIAIVVYSVLISMSFLFAKKHSYKILPNQELFALGLANIVGGLFSCMPISCSLSRSLILEQTGGKTQFAGVVTAFIILILLLWVGPFFEPLPRCVLAAVIISSLKGLIMQFRNLKQVSKRGKLEILTWLGTFLTVVLIDIDYGLVVGFATSLLSLYIKGWKASSAILGSVPGTEIYVELENHKDAEEIPGIKIFRYVGYINFATESSFKKKLHEALEWRQGMSNRLGKSAETLLPIFKVLIIDLTTVSHLDVAATKNLTEVINEMNNIGITVIFSAPTDRVYDALLDGMKFGEGPYEIFPTIHDAVLYAKGSMIDK